MYNIKFDYENNGYNREQVERYIEKIEKEYKELYKSCQMLEQEIKDNKKELQKIKKEADAGAATAVMMKAEMIARHTKKTAEKTAEEIEEKARKAAEEIVNDANEKAGDIIQSKKVIYSELRQIGEVIAYLVDEKRQPEMMSPEDIREVVKP